MFASSEVNSKTKGLTCWFTSGEVFHHFYFLFFKSSASDPGTRPCLEMAALVFRSSPEYNVFSGFLCFTYKNSAQGCLPST